MDCSGGPFSRWWSCRSFFVNCSWSTESTISFSWATFLKSTVDQNFWKTFMTMLILSVCSQSVLQFLWSLSNHHSMVSFSSATHPAELDHWGCLRLSGNVAWPTPGSWGGCLKNNDFQGRKTTRNYCAQDFLIFPIWCINIFYHFLSFSIIYCTAYCWWQPSRYRSWSRRNTRRTCLNFLAAFQRERRRRRRLENIQQNIKKKLWTVWTSISIYDYLCV